MFYSGRNLNKEESVLLDFALSDFDGKYLGMKSDPYTVQVDASAVIKTAYAANSAAPWNSLYEPIGNGLRSRPEALPAFYWHIINNTPTYRAYEEKFLQSSMKKNTAHLHTGDDYFVYEPIHPGDLITTTCEISVLHERPGRQGLMKFIEDIWKFRNQHGALVGALVRKAVTIYYTDRGSKGKPEIVAEPATLLPERTTRLDRELWTTPRVVDVFDGRPAGFVHDIGLVDGTMVIRWMGAVDDYARNHFDYDYARERGFPDGLPVLAGPHLGALMLAPIIAWAGVNAEVEEFRHVQRHPINPDERFTTFGFTEPDTATGKVRVKSWLVDDKGGVRHWATTLLRRRSIPHGGERSSLWAAA